MFSTIHVNLRRCFFFFDCIFVYFVKFCKFGQVQGNARDGRSRHRPTNQIFRVCKVNLATLNVANRLWNKVKYMFSEAPEEGISTLADPRAQRRADRESVWFTSFLAEVCGERSTVWKWWKTSNQDHTRRPLFRWKEKDVSTAYSSPHSAVKVGDQLQPPCSPRFRRRTQHILCSPGKPWSVTCGVLLLRDSLSHHLRALFNVCSQALDCASALDRVCRLQPLYLLMAARQTSIITTTAPPPAPTLATIVETEPAVLTSPVVVFPFVPALQRSHLAKCSQGRLQACS